MIGQSLIFHQPLPEPNLYARIYPFGLDLIGQHLESLGHRVKIALPFLGHEDENRAMEEVSKDFRPGIAGIIIWNMDTAMTMFAENFIAGIYNEDGRDPR